MADQCKWCLQKDVPLVNHHYPIPRAEGGTETVRICRNCHGRAHTDCYMDATLARTPEEYGAMIDQRADRVVKEYFPGLWAKGWEVFPANRALFLTPPWMWKNLTSEQQEEAHKQVEAMRQCYQEQGDGR